MTPTDALAASPPLLQIGANAGQLIRLVRTAVDAPAAEESYRVLIDELPAPGTPVENGITIRLRYSVPVFVEPPGMPAPPRAWRVERDAQGLRLAVDNRGGRRAQLPRSGWSTRKAPLTRSHAAARLCARRQHAPLAAQARRARHRSSGTGHRQRAAGRGAVDATLTRGHEPATLPVPTTRHAHRPRPRAHRLAAALAIALALHAAAARAEPAPARSARGCPGSACCSTCRSTASRPTGSPASSRSTADSTRPPPT